MAARLSEDEQKVLGVLRTNSGYWTFAGLCTETGLERAVVRRACRSLARRGQAVYGRGLWTEDGEMFGSGYAAKGMEDPTW